MAVCAIIVTYQRPELLTRCLRALAAQTHPVDQILVVDNGGDGAATRAVEALDATEPLEVVVCERPDNPGPAGGFAEGIRQARSQFPDAHLWLFNDDAWPEPEALEVQLATVADLTRWGILGVAFHADGSTRIAGGAWDRGNVRHATHLPIGGPVTEVDLLIFNGALVSHDAAAAVEPPTEGFWMMMEEWQYCLRVQDAGFSNHLLPHPLVHHDWGGAAGGVRPYYQTRNHLALVRERGRPEEIVGFVQRYSKFTAAALLKGDVVAVRLRLKGVADGLRGRHGRMRPSRFRRS